jgi:hypothetical protein
MVVFKYIFHCCKRSSSASEQNICSCKVNVAVLHLHPPAHSVKQCLHIHVMLSLHVVFQRTTQENMVPGQDCRVGVAWWYFAQGLFLSKASILTSLCFKCSCQKFTIVHKTRSSFSEPVTSQKTVAMIFPAGDILWISSYLGDVMCFQFFNCCLDSCL